MKMYLTTPLLYPLSNKLYVLGSTATAARTSLCLPCEGSGSVIPAWGMNGVFLPHSLSRTVGVWGSVTVQSRPGEERGTARVGCLWT